MSFSTLYRPALAPGRYWYFAGIRIRVIVELRHGDQHCKQEWKLFVRTHCQGPGNQ